MGMTKVTRNFQITLPRDIRKSININVGDEIIVSESDGVIIMKKVKKDSFEAAFGIFKDFKVDSVEYVRKMRDESDRLKRLGV